MDIQEPEALLRIVIALGAGAAIGWEREWRGKPAGLRTHALAALAAAVYAIVGLEIAASADGIDPAVRVDPMRIVPAVAVGLGFLGAGAIFRHGDSVEGLTTAGGLWVAGAAGLACGVGLIWIAGVAAVFAVGTLALLRVIEVRAIESKPKIGSGDWDDPERGRSSSDGSNS